MGPVVSEDLREWTLRPFKSSQTYQNLSQNGHCVFHVMDDVLPLVQLVLRLPHELEFERVESATEVQQVEHPIWRVASACRWFHLEIEEWNLESERSEAKAKLVDEGNIRPFWGWNRAKHAVLEATILTTRLHILERNVVEAEFQRLKSAIEKTAGSRETVAWNLLLENLTNYYKDGGDVVD